MLTSGNLYTQYIQKLTVLLKKTHKSKSHVNMKVHLSFCSKKKHLITHQALIKALRLKLTQELKNKY